MWRSVRFMVALCMAASAQLAVAEVRSESPACDNSTLHVTVSNLGAEAQSGYVGNGSAAAFSLRAKEAREVQLRVAHPGLEQKIVAYLPDGGQCAGYVELPSGCAPRTIAGEVFLYQGRTEPKCFVRSVAQHPRPGAALALSTTLRP